MDRAIDLLRQGQESLSEQTASRMWGEQRVPTAGQRAYYTPRLGAGGQALALSLEHWSLFFHLHVPACE